MRASRRRTWLVHLLFFVSGAVALVYEITWMGWLGQVFGGTAQAAAATLAAFFLGLGLGAAVLGRLARFLRRPLRAYGWLELGVCLTGLLGWLLHRDFTGISTTTSNLLSEGHGLLALRRLGLAVLWMGPTAFCLGATFPVLCEALVDRRDALGRRGALLYAVNTLGATAGALATTFVLVPAVGYQRTYLSAMGVVGLVGLVAWSLGRGVRTPPVVVREAPRLRHAASSGLAFGSGLLALALQVLWTRMFAQALPGSVYVFGTVVVVFLLGLGLAGLVAHALARRGVTTRSTLVTLLSLSGLAVAATVPLFLWRTHGLRPPAPGQAWGAYVQHVVLDAGLVLLPAVVVLGTVFPHLLKVAEARASGVGRIVGRLSAFNTLGAICGALLGGFVLLPVFGLWSSIRLAALAYAVGAIVVARGLRARVLTTVCALAVAATGLLAVSVVRVDAGERLLQVWEGPSGTVAVLERDGERKLVLDNVFTLGGTHDARWEAMQAHVPLCLHEHPRRVLFLGLGTGITAAAALEHPVDRVVVAEIVPEVIEAARAWFGDESGALFVDERVEIVATDARRVLRASGELYDVIVGDLFFPWAAGTASLYTKEHFEMVKAHLVEGGVFAQWLPCYQMSEDEVLGVMRTFAEVFGTAHVWRGDFFADRPLLALVGGTSDWANQADRLVDRARSLVGGSGDDLGRDADTIPWHLYAGPLRSDSELLVGACVLEADLPWLAWSAPRSERAHEGQGRFALMVGDRLLAFERRILPADAGPLVRAGLVMRRMGVALHALDRKAHARALLDYVRLVPADLRPDLERWIE